MQVKPYTPGGLHLSLPFCNFVAFHRFLNCLGFFPKHFTSIAECMALKATGYSFMESGEVSQNLYLVLKLRTKGRYGLVDAVSKCYC